MMIPVHFSPEQLDYVRRVLGTRPHDESRPVIFVIEQAVEAFNAYQQTKAEPPTEATKTGHNGAAHAS